MKKVIKKISKYKYFNIVITAFLTILLVSIFDLFGYYDSFELRLFDFRTELTADYNKPDTNIVMVAIDDNSLEFFEKNEVSWPWPREFYGVVLDYLKYAGAKAAIFDIHFSSREIARMDVDPEESERKFSESMQNFGKAYLVASMIEKKDGDELGNELVSKHLFKDYNLKLNKNYKKAESPIESFQTACKGVGVVTLNPDKDNIIRRIPLVFQYKSAVVPQISMLVYHDIYGQNKPLKYYKDNIPVDDQNNFIIKWYGGGGITGKVFKYYPITDLLVSGYKISQGLEPVISSSYFKDKIVIIGGTAHGLFDYKPVAISSSEPYPGMEIHATILSNLVNRDYFIQVSNTTNYIIVVIFALIVPLIFFKIKKIWVSVPLIIIIIGSYAVINILLFGKLNYVLSFVLPELTLFFGFLVSSVISYVVEGRQKKEIRKTFNRYMSPQVIDEILKNPDEIELGGREIEATVFFSDIKDFTSISEKYPPVELVSYLNEYFSKASDIILDYKAMLDKYIGDAIMAIFGAPLYQKDHALSACLAALRIQQVLSEVYGNSKEEGKPEFITRIGLNTGRMIVGNIGTSARLDYTAIGDTVNTASRLEGMNKLYDTRIIVSENTYSQVKDFVEVRELDFMTVKGKNIPLRIYELLGEKDKVSDVKMEKKTIFEEALKLYRNREWDTAIAKFKSVFEIEDEDLSAKLYIQRCEAFKLEPPPENWDGVFHAKTK